MDVIKTIYIQVGEVKKTEMAKMKKDDKNYFSGSLHIF